MLTLNEYWPFADGETETGTATFDEPYAESAPTDIMLSSGAILISAESEVTVRIISEAKLKLVFSTVNSAKPEVPALRFGITFCFTVITGSETSGKRDANGSEVGPVSVPPDVVVSDAANDPNEHEKQRQRTVKRVSNFFIFRFTPIGVYWFKVCSVFCVSIFLTGSLFISIRSIIPSLI